jgi:hypothetical protein
MITKTNQKSVNGVKELSKFLPKSSPFKERLSLNKEEKVLFEGDRRYGGCSSWRS